MYTLDNIYNAVHNPTTLLHWLDMEKRTGSSQSQSHLSSSVVWQLLCLRTSDSHPQPDWEPASAPPCPLSPHTFSPSFHVTFKTQTSLSMDGEVAKVDWLRMAR